MEELEFIQNERLKLQEKYLKEAKNIWIEFDGEEADKKHKKLHSEYRNKDYQDLQTSARILHLV